MDKSDIILAAIMGLVALCTIGGAIYLAYLGREALHTDSKIINAGLTLWIADHLISIILGIIVFFGVLYGIILYLIHFGFK
ncbi:MAG: hypothetical protein LBV43_02755 [Prevotella sp.]|jgi:hypothetical protein|nr:hypothetical protein [Prevotella sp.]